MIALHFMGGVLSRDLLYGRLLVHIILFLFSTYLYTIVLVARWDNNIPFYVIYLYRDAIR